MGLIYIVQINCLLVKNYHLLDERRVVVKKGNIFDYNNDVKQYCKELKKNLLFAPRIYRHKNVFENGYSMVNLKIPQDSNVLSFRNSTQDNVHYGSTSYQVDFYNVLGNQVKCVKLDLDREENRFTVKIPSSSYSFRYVIDSESGYKKTPHFFDYEEGTCLTCKTRLNVENVDCRTVTYRLHSDLSDLEL
jgi:hypothetical protein